MRIEIKDTDLWYDKVYNALENLLEARDRRNEEDAAKHVFWQICHVFFGGIQPDYYWMDEGVLRALLEEIQFAQGHSIILEWDEVDAIRRWTPKEK